MDNNEKQLINATFKTDQEKYQIGDPIWLKISIENVSQGPLYIFVPDGKANEIEFKVLNTETYKIIDTAEDRTVELIGEKKLDPGNSYSQQYLLNQWLIFEKAGSYSVECKIPIEYSNTSIRQKKSNREVNSITFTSIADISIVTDVKQNNSKKRYKILVWDWEKIFSGLLVDQDLELKEVKIKPPIEDIRNCSAAKKKPLIALSGINKKTKNNELW